MYNYIIRIFHLLIIANLFIIFSGCGYKSDPVYQNQDENHQYLSKNEKIENIKKVKQIANI